MMLDVAQQWLECAIIDGLKAYFRDEGGGK